MLLADVEPSKKGDAGLVRALIILEDGLVRDLEVLAYNFARCFLAHLNYNLIHSHPSMQCSPNKL